MSASKRLLTLLCVLLSITYAHGQETWSKVRILPSADLAARNHLLGLLEIDHFETDNQGAVISEISKTQLEVLRSSGFAYQVLIADVAAHLDSVNQLYYASLKKKGNQVLGRVAMEQPGGTLDKIIPKPAAFEVKSTFGGYYSFAEMEAAMNTLVTTYPTIAQKISIGKTHEGRDIWVIKISDNVATDEANEPELLYIGLQHAREAVTGASMIFFMQYLCEQYAKDNRIRDLVDNRVFFIIPCFNPDGWEYNRLNGGAGSMWRKNRSPVDSTLVTKTSGQGKDKVTYTVWEHTVWGVDLNRNWGVDWAHCSAPIQGPSTSCGSGTKSSDTYWGSNAFSEKETQALRDFTKSRNIVVGFDQHAYGPYYSLPFGRQSLHKDEMPQKGKDFFTAVPALMGKYNGMRAADSYDALGYEVAGGFKDWMLMGEHGSSIGAGRKDTVWAITGEGGAGGSSNSFWAQTSQIVNLCKGMTYQNLQLAFAAGTYVDIQDLTDIAIQNTTGQLSFRVKRLGLGNNPVKVTLLPLENIISGGSVTISGMNYYEESNQSISYSLPAGIGNGQRVKFAWLVETDGYKYADTVIKFYNPFTLLADDMEGTSVSANWTVTNGWNYSADAHYEGAKALTESPGGNYSAGATRIATNNNVLNLTGASGAFLTFWTKYRAENFRDKLQLQVSANSTDGVNGTWTAIAGKHTIQEPGTLDGSTIDGQPSLTGIQDFWTQEVFNLEAYKGTAGLRFRFVFTSDNVSSSFKYNQDDGFYIDNLKVIKTEANFSVLPVQFIDFWGKAVPENKVQLNWRAVTDEQHDYFEVERSADGIHFTALGKTSGSSFAYLDVAPRVGNNFYRIRQYDKNGKYSYSKIINVVMEPAFKLLVFPNPVHDYLYVNFSNRQNAPLKLQITDLQGRKIYETLKNAGAAEAIRIDVQSWKPQLYILKILGNNNEVIETQKIIKL